MKKIVFLFSVFLVALSAKATYIYWQVAPYGDNTTWNAVSVFLYDKDTKSVRYDIGALENYDNGNSAGTLINDADANDRYIAYYNETLYTGDYGYYVEYYNYSGAGDVNIANDKVAGGIVTTPTVYDSTSISISDLPTASAGWAAPATYTAVPEPTSGLLLMFGAAMLGLKRKNRSRA